MPLPIMHPRPTPKATPAPATANPWADTEMALESAHFPLSGHGHEPWPLHHDMASTSRPLGTKPIKLPDPELQERARAARQRIERDVEAARLERELRQTHALHAAQDNGQQLGFRRGYTEGWHWGLWCGVLLGALLTIGIAFASMLLRTQGFM